MSGEVALPQRPPVHFIAAGNETEQICSPPTSPFRTGMTRVATFPPSNPDFVFPKISDLKPSPATSDSDLFRITRTSVSESSQDFQVKLTQLIASLRGESASQVLAVIDEKVQVMVKRSQSVKTGVKVKKRVRFSDDHGAELVQIRITNEPTDVPPILTSETALKFLREFPQEPVPEAKPTWCVDFPQPGSNYVRCRKRLEQDNVVLVNVVIQPCQTAGDGKQKCRLVGTVRVQDVAFEKKVFLRLTENNWISYSDRPAYYSGSSEMEDFDTFTFNTEILVDDDFHPPRVEFCIGYQAGRVTYWDNNELKNYAVLWKRVNEF